MSAQLPRRGLKSRFGRLLRQSLIMNALLMIGCCHGTHYWGMAAGRQQNRHLAVICLQYIITHRCYQQAKDHHQVDTCRQQKRLRQRGPDGGVN